MRIKKVSAAFLIVVAILGVSRFVRSAYSPSEAEGSEDRGKATAASQEEPSYQGHSLTELIADLNDEHWQVRMRAVEFLGYMGPKAKPAVPALVDLLAEERMREMVLHSLGNIAVGAEEAIPALITAMAEYEPACPWYAARALANIGEAAVPALMEATTSQNIYLRIWSNAALATNESPDSQHLRYLLEPMNSGNKRASNVALRAMKMLGQKSIPLLPDLIEAMKDPRVSNRDIAEVLAIIGPAGRPAAYAAMAELLKMLESKKPDEVIEAARAVGAIGGPEVKSAVPLLIQALKAKDTSSAFIATRQPHIRAQAARSLGSIGPGAHAAIPHLIITLRDEDEFVRRNSATSIGQIDPTDLEAVPALIKAMQDESGRVRGAAAQTLLKIGPVNKEVVLAFVRAWGDNWRNVSYAADELFHLLGPEHSEVVPELVRMAMAEDLDRRRKAPAIEALVRIGDIPVEMVPALVEALQGGSGARFPLYAAEAALVRAGPKAKAAVPELIEMLDHEDRAVIHCAARVLASIGPEARAAIPAMANCLRKGPHIRVCESLLELDPDSEEAIETLTKITKRDYRPDQPTDQPGAHYSLIKYGQNKEQNLQGLIAALERSNPSVRWTAAAYLGKLGATATKAIPALRKALNDENPEVRVEAAEAMLLIGLKGSERREATEAIVNSLEHPDMAGVRAASALEAFGPEEKWAVPALATRIQDGSVRTRVAAIKALGNIGPGPREALPSLKRLLKDEHYQIRQAAAKAIEKLEH